MGPAHRFAARLSVDLCLVDAMGHGRVLTTLPKAISGTHVSDSRVEMLRARTIDIESKDGFPFHVDGEVIDERRNRLHIEMHPAKLKVIAGAGALGGRPGPDDTPAPGGPLDEESSR